LGNKLPFTSHPTQRKVPLFRGRQSTPRWRVVTVVKVNREVKPPSYTVQRADGSEVETESKRLTPCEEVTEPETMPRAEPEIPVEKHVSRPPVPRPWLADRLRQRLNVGEQENPLPWATGSLVLITKVQLGSRSSFVAQS